jgi:hypothetical protein
LHAIDDRHDSGTIPKGALAALCHAAGVKQRLGPTTEASLSRKSLDQLFEMTRCGHQLVEVVAKLVDLGVDAEEARVGQVGLRLADLALLNGNLFPSESDLALGLEESTPRGRAGATRCAPSLGKDPAYRKTILVSSFLIRASEPAHHHPSCGSQCDAAIANAISVPTVNVVSAAVLGASD